MPSFAPSSTKKPRSVPIIEINFLSRLPRPQYRVPVQIAKRRQLATNTFRVKGSMLNNFIYSSGPSAQLVKANFAEFSDAEVLS
jgi:hypothetical protein